MKASGIRSQGIKPKLKDKVAVVHKHVVNFTSLFVNALVQL